MESLQPTWVSTFKEKKPIRIGKSGYEAATPMTIMETFEKITQKFESRIAFSRKKEGQWVSYTWGQYRELVKQCARAFISLDVTPSDSVAILGFNSPEWFISFLGAIFCGAKACAIYTTNGAETCKYIVENCSATVVVVDSPVQREKILQVNELLEDNKQLKIIEWNSSDDELSSGVLSFEAFMALGEAALSPAPDSLGDQLEWRMKEQRPDSCASLIYTSGTTGPPKGVMLSHDNFTWTATTGAAVVGITEEDVLVSFLPLSHVAGQVLDIFMPMVTGCKVVFASPDALKGSLVVTLREARPTLMLAVPRVWEKMMFSLKEAGAQTKGLKRSIASWAKGVGLRGNTARQYGRSVPWGWTIADTLVFSKVKHKLGLDRCRGFFTAAAPLRPDVQEFLASLNMPLYEIYGLSEATGPHTISYWDGHYRFGSVGQALAGTEIRIAGQPAGETDGEILLRGRNIFMGYLGNSAESQDSLDDEGWLHTGDQGHLDEEGFLYITGRFKELIITAGGENVPPRRIEELLVSNGSPLIARVFVVGDQKKFLSCLLALQVEMEGECATERLTAVAQKQWAKAGVEARVVQDVVDSETAKDIIQKSIDLYNDTQAISRAQKIQCWRILPTDFSIAGGEMTPTMKIKRKVVQKKYADEIEAMYN
eukprot:GCRY01002774.1.p1 GENE.GCRY01002774.1~~GCRY01002774.1.p1  ORF type:complete len:654 (+),score=167.21 GCRY01002774.1:167-2128(+)